MASSMDTTDLTGLLECSICLDQYDNPKHLTCTHNFCKICLEDIIKFNADGSATIVCPLRCTEKTIIGVNRTVNDLKASYDIKYILEALRQKENKSVIHPLCANSGLCNELVSVFFLRTLMCRKCYDLCNKMDCGEDDKVSLIFDKTSSKLQVFCEDHSTRCSHLCSDGQFLCMYCMHRSKDHINLTKNTIAMEITSLKETLNNLVSEKRRFLDFQDATEETISKTKAVLAVALEERRLKSALESADLIAEEERIKKMYDNFCVDHMKQYKNETHLRLSDYFDNMLEKTDVEILLLKNEVLMHAQEYHNIELETEVVVFNQASNVVYPLGSLDLSKAASRVLPSDPPYSTLHFHIVVLDSQADASTGYHSSTLTEDGCINSQGVENVSGVPIEETNKSAIVTDTTGKSKKKKNMEHLEGALDNDCGANDTAVVGATACSQDELLKSKNISGETKALVEEEKEENEVEAGNGEQNTSKRKKKKRKKKKNAENLPSDRHLAEVVQRMEAERETARKGKALLIKTYSDSTLRRVCQTALASNVCCMSGATTGNLMNAIDIDPDPSPVVLIVSGINLLHCVMEPVEFVWTLRKSAERLQKLAAEKQVIFIPPPRTNPAIAGRKVKEDLFFESLERLEKTTTLLVWANPLAAYTDDGGYTYRSMIIKCDTLERTPGEEYYVDDGGQHPSIEETEALLRFIDKKCKETFNISYILPSATSKMLTTDVPYKEEGVESLYKFGCGACSSKVRNTWPNLCSICEESLKHDKANIKSAEAFLKRVRLFLNNRKTRKGGK